MKITRNCFIVWSAVILMVFAAGCSKNVNGPRYVLFDWFEYQGQDSVFEVFSPQNGEFLNPILPGFYPDPSICRVENDYYLVNSTFSYFPGIPIFHSRDLVHWEQLGHVLDRPSQLKLDSLPLSGGVFAPAISYNKGVFYVINTLVQGGGNFYVTANDPRGPWSEPVWLPEIDGIDPSFFFDEDGKAYVVNNGPPDGEELYSGHRALWIQEFSTDSGKLTGPRKVIVNAGVDISKKPIWIEGPHILKKDNYYYLIAAEGGTATDHSEVVFRSASVWGPYVPADRNPMLTQRHLDNRRDFPVTSTGHADFVETQTGEWWAVFLGCRPYIGDFYNTGRETFMLLVKWEGGWPYITNMPVPYKVKKPALPEYKPGKPVLNGNFTWRDEFNDTTLAMPWNFIRTPREKWFNLNSKTGMLKIDIRPVSIRERQNPSFIGRRQQHAFFTAVVAMQPGTMDTAQTAGLIAFQNEKHYLFLGLEKTIRGFRLVAERSGSDVMNGEPQQMAVTELPVGQQSVIYLRITGRGDTYDLAYALKQNEWITLAGAVDARNLSTHVGGGFVGAYLGLYASSAHQTTN